MEVTRLLRSSLQAIGLVHGEPDSSAEAPLPLCLTLEQELRRLRPSSPIQLTWLLERSHVIQGRELAQRLSGGAEPVSAFIRGRLSAATRDLLRRAIDARPEDGQRSIDAALDALLPELNRMLETQGLGAEACFATLDLTSYPFASDLLAREPKAGGDACIHLNRLLLEAAYPSELAAVHETRLSALYSILHDQGTLALCLSGGGIRSATFALGVVQALARYGLFEKFDFLSTVSGGGYLGGWLAAWIHRREQTAAVVKELHDSVAGPEHSGPKSAVAPEPRPISYLRDYSNYLSPKLGLFSADTWTLVAIYVRNLVLNWLVIIPFLGAVLMVPMFAVTVVVRPDAVFFWFPALVGGLVLLPIATRRPSRAHPTASDSGRADPGTAAEKSRGGTLAAMAVGLGLFTILGRVFWQTDWLAALPPLIQWTLAAGFVLGGCAVYQIHTLRPAGRRSFRARFQSEARADQDAFLRRCLAPLLGATVLLTTAWAWLVATAAAAGRPPIPTFEAGLFGWSVWLTPSAQFGLFGAALHLTGWAPAQWRTKRLTGIEPLLVATSGSLAGAAAYWTIDPLFIKGLGDPASAVTEWYVVFALPLFLVFIYLAGTLYDGITSRTTGTDEDREWAARFGAWVLIASIGWSLLCVLVVFGPPLLLWLPSSARAAVGSMGGLAGLIALVRGKSSGTAAAHGRQATSPRLMSAKVLLPLATVVFAVVFLALVSLGDSLLIQAVSPSAGGCSMAAVAYDPGKRLEVLHCASPFAVLPLIVGLVLVSLLAGYLINTNKFSLHALYRNRLIRAYLGASHGSRSPDPFIGFDPGDNIPMCQLWPGTLPPVAAGQAPQAVAPQTPMPVINLTLNLVQGDKLAWQERKAEPFTVTPLHAGGFRIGYRRLRCGTKFYGGPRQGISLGTAVTISGAAASSNMGYHSSPIVGALMTLFNIRLGWWLGNPGPAGNHTFNLSSPKWSIRPIVEEALGMTNDRSPYVYLSDGGHFENLGLYEMVLRRSHVIVVSDAGCDPACSFEDLGNAIRKIRIDLGIPIEFSGKQPLMIYPRSEGRVGRYAAIGTIQYSAVDRPRDPARPVPDGVLIYLKPAFYGSEPRDIYNYARTSPDFPHESTADQFFGEAQFESYRALGYHIGKEVLSLGEDIPGDRAHSLEELAQAYLARPVADDDGRPFAEAAEELERLVDRIRRPTD